MLKKTQKVKFKKIDLFFNICTLYDQLADTTSYTVGYEAKCLKQGKL